MSCCSNKLSVGMELVPSSTSDLIYREHSKRGL